MDRKEQFGIKIGGFAEIFIFFLLQQLSKNRHILTLCNFILMMTSCVIMYDIIACIMVQKKKCSVHSLCFKILYDKKKIQILSPEVKKCIFHL